jgi:prepilin-type N-terminal cleavage/methylation domain-containing protein
MSKSSVSDETGLTLIELMIAMVVLAVIIGPVVTSMLLGLLSTSGTRDRIADAAGAQLLSSYFPADIQSAGGRTTTGTLTSGIATTGLGRCTNALPVGSIEKLNITIPDPAASTDPTKQTTVIYYTKPAPSGGALELYRRQCNTSSSTDVTIQVVQYIESGTDWNPTCSPDTTTCLSVNVTYRALNPASSNSYSGETYTVRGSRRITQ